MEIGRAIKRRVRDIAAPAFFIALVAYFAWNVTSGDHGLVAAATRERLLAQAQQDLKQAIAQREELRTRISGLEAEHIDPDLLEELARKQNLSDPNDLVLRYDPRDKLF